MAPTGIFVVVAPTVSSVISRPSTCIRVVRPLRPTTEAAVSPLLEGASTAPSRNCTPGSSGVKSRNWRSVGICSICSVMTAPRTSADSVSTSLAEGATTRSSLTSPVAVPDGLDSDQKIGGLKPFGLHVQNIFSRRQVADGVGAGRAGCGAGGLSRYFIGDGKVGSADRCASRPGYRSGDIAGGRFLGVGRRRKNEKDRYRSGPQT